MSQTQEDFPPMKNTRVLDCIHGRQTEKPPIWFMGQVGTYLPEFREVCRDHEYLDIGRTPALACEATMMPMKRFRLDAAIIFSDIFVIPQSLGMDVRMSPVPVDPKPLTSDTIDQEQHYEAVLPKPLTLDTIEQLQHSGAVNRLKYVADAITLTRINLQGEATLIGFSGAPWTLMSYMIEGGHSTTFSQARKWLYAHKEKAQRVLEILTEVVGDYCVMQAKAGAQVIQLFDTNAEYLNKDLYHEFCLPGLLNIREKVKAAFKDDEETVPMIIFAKGAVHSIKDLVEMGYEIIGLDWMIEPSVARSLVQSYHGVCLQGNLDPCVLYADPKDIRERVNTMLEKFADSKLIVNLGHGINPDTPIEGVHEFITAVRQFYNLHKCVST